MIKATKNMLQSTFDYKNKLGRADFWWGYLGYMIIAAITATVFILLSDNISEFFAIIGTIMLLCLELSTITAFMRRLNDVGINKAFALIFVIHLGIFVLVFLLAQLSKEKITKKSE